MTKRRRWTPTKLARPSRLFPVLVLVLCYAAPIQLGSQSKQVDPGGARDKSGFLVFGLIFTHIL